MEIRFRLKTEDWSWLDFSDVSFDQMNDLSVSQIRDVSVRCDRSSRRLGDLFQIDQFSTSAEGGASVNSSEPVFHIVGNLRRSTGIGTGFARGRIVIEGAGGDRLGERLRGGTLIVCGDAGSSPGAGMLRGHLLVLGNCGSRLAGPLPGHLKGMSGGSIVVLGSAGDRVAERMRRGMICVQGACGEETAIRMIAGTLFTSGLGAGACNGMKRGTVIVPRFSASQSDAEFTSARSAELNYLPLFNAEIDRLRRHFQDGIGGVLESELPWRFPKLESQVSRCVGDRRVGGLGEVLCFSR